NDRLPAVDHAGRACAHCTAGTRLDCAECNLDIPFGQLTVERATHLLHLYPEALCDEMDRCLPSQLDKPWRLQHRLEVERASKAHTVYHHVGDRIVIVQRDLGGCDGLDVF